MGKPRMIIIIRHAQSEGNRDKNIHQKVPDHKVGLTTEGHEQAREAGRKLRELLRPDDSLHFFISPYLRTRQTTEGILSSLCTDEPDPTPFPRRSIKVYEEPRLREQDFGNFQPCTEEVERLWHERAAYGHFFYRIPNGESGADCYDRVASFNGSLWRRFQQDDMASVAILVTHGLCSRVFLMVWYHYSVEFFEDLRNINHCEFLVMKLAPNGKYILQNKLRRWSDLKRERNERRSVSSPTDIIPVRRWVTPTTGYDANGERYQKKKVVRQNTADLFQDDPEVDDPGEEVDDQRAADNPMFAPPFANDGHLIDSPFRPDKHEEALRQSVKQMSPVGSRVTLKVPNHRLPFRGRDGGGTRSGAASPFDSSEDENASRSTPRVEEGTRTSPLGPPSDGISPGGFSHISPSYSSRSPGSTNLSPADSALSRPSLSELQALRRSLNSDLGDPSRILADALGDKSDKEVDEADEELGTKERQRREMARILTDEKRERSFRKGQK